VPPASPRVPSPSATTVTHRRPDCHAYAERN
jgi:hypothetical protein